MVAEEGGTKSFVVHEPGCGVLNVAPGARSVPFMVKAGKASIDQCPASVLIVRGYDKIAIGAENHGPATGGWKRWWR